MRARALAVGGLGGMAAHVGFGQVENQPAAPDIGGRKPQLVAEKHPQFFWSRRVKHRVYAFDHGTHSPPKNHDSKRCAGMAAQRPYHASMSTVEFTMDFEQDGPRD